MIAAIKSNNRSMLRATLDEQFGNKLAFSELPNLKNKIHCSRLMMNYLTRIFIENKLPQGKHTYFLNRKFPNTEIPYQQISKTSGVFQMLIFFCIIISSPPCFLFFCFPCFPPISTPPSVNHASGVTMHTAAYSTLVY